jgi:hypothetical protein
MNATATTGPDTRTWPELAIGLYDALTGRNAEITYEFEDFGVGIPSAASADAARAQWSMNGKIKIRTRNTTT